MWQETETRLTGVHGTGRYGIDAHAATLELLGHATGEVLYRSLGPGVGGVKAREGGKKRGDDRDELSSVRNMLSAGLEDEEGGFRIDAGYCENS